MTTRIAINGLGRIGRCVVRAMQEYHGQWDIELVAVNSSGDTETKAHLLRYDSVHGRYRGDVKALDANRLDLGFGGPVKAYSTREVGDLDWAGDGVDIVLDCTGKFKSKKLAGLHLAQGAKKVLVSAPSPDADATIVYGVNNGALKQEHTVISVGSCTTNCLAPVAKVLNDAVGIEHGYMTTIHAYTGDQNIHDGSHTDPRRARAAAMSMVPTSTGAAKALGLVLPELKGKLDGTAIRVPTPNVSMVDLAIVASRDVTVDEINTLMQDAANGVLKGVLAYNDEPLVSVDFNHDPHSSIFDATGTAVTGGKLVRVASWYDNEWGFSCRMLDLAVLAGRP